MLSLLKRFNPINVVKLPKQTQVTVEKAAEVPKSMTELLDALDDIGRVSLETASREWAEAVSALHEAQQNFDDADEDYRDTAIAALNVAHMRVDVAQRYIKKLLGIPNAEEREQLQKQQAQEASA